jgi:hypothetical protein
MEINLKDNNKKSQPFSAVIRLSSDEFMRLVWKIWLWSYGKKKYNVLVLASKY